MGKRYEAVRECPFCGSLMRLSNLGQHTPSCLRNPDVEQRILSFLREHAVDGRIMPQKEYKELSAQNGLPTRQALYRWFDNWLDVALWAGLEPTAEDRLNAPDPVRVSDIRDAAMEGMAAYRAIRLVREWRPREKVYEPVGWQKVLVLK